jgi:hypothetical protein
LCTRVDSNYGRFWDSVSNIPELTGKMPIGKPAISLVSQPIFGLKFRLKASWILPGF